MSAPIYEPSKPGRQSINGITPGGSGHLMLLALRGVGGMTSDQMNERWPGASGTLNRLRLAGLVEMPGTGKKGFAIVLTASGRALTDPDGPLSRRATLNTYCQL